MYSASDIHSGDWIDRYMPAGWRPYMRLARLDRPIGTWLLLLPCFWSIAMAARPGEGPDLRLFILFAIGALVMRGAGCTINDMADRDIDIKVARTATRPLASGVLTMTQAVLFLGLQLLIGLFVLLSLTETAIWLGIASLSLVAAYPFMKRITWWPQVVLGMAFNWGALLGWAAVRDEFGIETIPLYLAGICWTLVYDTIYAHQDKADDALVGVKSTALRFGKDTKAWLTGFAIAMVLLIAIAFESAQLAWPAYLGLILVAAHLIWQLKDVDLDKPKDCLAKFKSNRNLGLLLLLGIILARWLG
ncbi:4-hydroxybenzoate octaprenyltransferase [Dongia soli]|uniref:4-hydroxybenzoate octaprenyltransferase n=1 Tax=Dongia soli TaxID=600628 RepID=A0ABU5E845_9PROT|nr:4-hydroxybenzoate octaprenyltransferase [Dongia soli]MDY0882466.1 4-hydroxybenzoate octaprenyltransferase [Dongia soli]